MLLPTMHINDTNIEIELNVKSEEFNLTYTISNMFTFSLTLKVNDLKQTI